MKKLVIALAISAIGLAAPMLAEVRVLVHEVPAWGCLPYFVTTCYPYQEGGYSSRAQPLKIGLNTLDPDAFCTTAFQEARLEVGGIALRTILAEEYDRKGNSINLHLDCRNLDKDQWLVAQRARDIGAQTDIVTRGCTITEE